MKTYRVGIVGCGRIASLYEQDRRAKKYIPYLTHAGAFSSHQRTAITTACDIDAGRLREFGKTWQVESLYQDYGEMLAKEEIDILSICTHPDSHLPIIKEAAPRVGLIFCEKPLGRDLTEVMEINETCTQSNCLLSVNLYRLFDPSHRKVGQMIRAGEIGNVQRVNAFYGKGLLNMGSHLISLLMDYFGEIESVSTVNYFSMNSYPEETPDFYATFTSGMPCMFQACDFDHYRIFEVDILGEIGRIVISDEGLTMRSYRVMPNRAETGAKELRLKRPTLLKSTLGEAFYWAVDNLVGTLDGSQSLLSPGDNYVALQKVMSAVAESWRCDSRKVRAN